MALTTQEILRALAEPFDADDVRWRCGHKAKDNTKAMALAYMDARCAEERLDEVLGAGWQCRYSELRNGAARGGQDSSPSIIVCEIGILLPDHGWIWRANGAGDTDVEAEKGALSDAFKRAATKWGIGRYLYGFPSPWAEIVPQGKSFVFAKHELPRLRALAQKAVADYRANPKSFRAPDDEHEPERPAFAPAAPPARPEPPPRPAAPAPAPSAAPAKPASDGVADILAAHISDLAAAVAHARRQSPGLRVEEAYLARARQILDGATTIDEVESLVAVLKFCKPADEAVRALQRAVPEARKRITEQAR